MLNKFSFLVLALVAMAALAMINCEDLLEEADQEVGEKGESGHHFSFHESRLHQKIADLLKGEVHSDKPSHTFYPNTMAYALGHLHRDNE